MTAIFKLIVTDIGLRVQERENKQKNDNKKIYKNISYRRSSKNWQAIFEKDGTINRAKNKSLFFLYI